jgi:hypothetical protein
VLLRVDERAADRVDAAGDPLVPEVDGSLIDEPLGAKTVRVG